MGTGLLTLHHSSPQAGQTPANAVDTVELKAVGNITELSAVELSKAIKTKRVSCVEVMEAYLSNIYRLNPKFKAIVSLQDRQSLIKQARQKDIELAAGTYHGWMHGFPIAVKDLAMTKGLPTTMGSPLLKGFTPEYDEFYVERIKAQGAIIIGKTNVPEFGLGSQSYNTLFGTTYSAYDHTATAGGSSGGAGAALGLNLVPVADGSDMMGSLRNPAAYNNVIGFRPSFNLVPFGPAKESFIQQLAVNGPMGKTVTDVAMLLSTMAGPHPSTPLSNLVNPEQFAQDLFSDTKGLKIGWLGDFDGYLPMEDGVLYTCEQSLAFFEQIGCSVEKVSVDFPMEDLWRCWLVHRNTIVAGLLQDLYKDPQKRKHLKPEAIWEIESAAQYSAVDYFNASATRSAWYKTIKSLHQHYDFLVLPTAQIFPFDGQIHWPKSVNGKKMDTYHRWMEIVVGGTLSGCPVINVPAGFNEKKLPMGMQIIGAMNKDLDVLKIAYAYEQASRWNLDHPSPYL